MMFLIGLGARALGVGRWLLDLLRAIPWQVYAVLAGIALGWVGYGKAASAIERGKAAAYAAGVDAADRKWKDAQAEADRQQAARNARTTKVQADISNEVDNAHAQARDAILRRSDDIRLRHEAAVERRRRDAVRAGLPSTGEAACLAHAEGYDGLSWGVAHRLLTTAALQQRQLNDLIDWNERQAAVQP